MSFKDLKRKQSRSRGPAKVASVIASVESVTDDDVFVRISAGAAQRLGHDADALLRLAIQDLPGQTRQPGIADLLGKKGRVLPSVDMRVEANSMLKLENVNVKEDTITARWVSLAAGPRALANDPIPPTIVDGYIRTAPVRNKDGERRWRTTCLDVRNAATVESVEDLQSTVEDLLSRPDIRQNAMIRMSSRDTGEVADPEYAGRRYDRDTGTLESAADAADRAVSGRIRQGIDSEDTIVEVIPLMQFMIGDVSGAQIDKAWEETINKPSVRGSRKFVLTEIHPDQRLPGRGELNNPAAAPTEKQVALADIISTERDRPIPDGVKSTAGSISAWIEGNTAIMGFARGEIALRHRINEQTGEQHAFPVGTSSYTLSGYPPQSISTPGNDNAFNYARAAAAEAKESRTRLLADATVAAAPSNTDPAEVTDVADPENVPDAEGYSEEYEGIQVSM